jgi:hypothetical protein
MKSRPEPETAVPTISFMMTDSTTAVYAVVDKSKKRRRNSIVENEVALPSFDIMLSTYVTKQLAARIL